MAAFRSGRMIQFKEFCDYKNETAIERLNKFVKDNKVKVIDYKYQVVTDNLRTYSYILLEYKVEE